MTTTTKTAKSYTEAMELVKEFHAIRPDCCFVYNTTTYDNNYKTANRFFGGIGEDGLDICFAMIETIEDGKLVNVRVINTYRDTAIDIKINAEENATKAKNTMEKFLKAKEEIACRPGRYLGNDRFAKQWKRSLGYKWVNISKDTAAFFLEYYGLTVKEYLAAQEQWIASEIARGTAQMAIDDQARFIKDKIARESKAINEEFTANVMPADDDDPKDEIDDTEDEIDAAEDNVEAESVNDEKPEHTTDDELNQPPTAEELYKMFAKTIVNANAMNVTLQNGRKMWETRFEGAYVEPEYYYKHWFIKDNLGFLFARYDTPAQVETVIKMLKAAIERGDKEFTFPTVEELSAPVVEILKGVA